MSDIFDQIEEKRDIFDEIEPAGDIFDEIGAEPVGPQTATATATAKKPLSRLTGEIITSETIPDRELLTQENLQGLTTEQIVDREKGLRGDIGDILQAGGLIGTPEERRTQAEQEFRAAKQTEKASFLDEFGKGLARETGNVAAAMLEKAEEASAGSIFEPGTFAGLAEPLREFSESAALEAAEVPEDAPFKEKAKVFVANAVGSTIPFMAASVASTVATGTPLAAFGTSFIVEGQNAKREALQAGATERQAEIEGFVVGTINGALEKLQVDEILRFSGVSKGTVRAIIEAAREKSLKTIAKKGGRLTLEVLKNSVTEGIQEALQETTSVLAPALTGREIEPGAVKRIGLAGLGGAIVGPIFGGAVDTQAVLGQAIGEQAQEISQIGSTLNETAPDADGFRSIELENAEKAQEAAEAFAKIAEQEGINVEIKTDAGKLSIKEITPAVGEDVITPIKESEVSDARQRDQERREELRVRERPLEEEQRVGPAEAEEALEAGQRVVQQKKRLDAGLTETGAAQEVAPTPAGKIKSPAVREFLARKEKSPKTAFFMKMGDFFETYGEDAERLGEFLGKKAVPGRGTKLIAIPAHEMESALEKIVRAGTKVGVVTPTSQKPTGEIKRDVVRLGHDKMIKEQAKQPESTIIPETPQIRQDVSDAVDFDPEKPTTSARQAQIDEDRKNLGLKDINSTSRRGWNQALKQAKSENIPSRANAIADEVNASPRSLSDVETAGLTMKMAELKSVHKQLISEIEQTKDATEIESKAAQVTRIEQEFDNLSRAVRLSGSEKGRALASQKLTIDEDLSLVSVLSRAKANKRSDLTSKERAVFKKKITELENRIQAIETARAEEAAQIARGQLRRGTKRFTAMAKTQRQAASKALGQDVKSLLEQGCNN